MLRIFSLTKSPCWPRLRRARSAAVEELAPAARSCAKEEEVEGSRRQHAQAAVARCYAEEEEGSSGGL
jgi:hypothetical protein